jgi:hypothetical protein
LFQRPPNTQPFQVWGGTRSFNRNKTPQLLAAIRDFTEHYPDPKAGVIVTAESTAFGLVDIWVMFFFYDGSNPPPHVFENFTKIAHTASDTHTRSYEDLLVANNKFSLSGSVYTVSNTAHLSAQGSRLLASRLPQKLCRSQASRMALPL